jgi:hypothetical protein
MLAFLPAERVPLLGIEQCEGIRLLTECKHAFTKVLLDVHSNSQAANALDVDEQHVQGNAQAMPDPESYA